MRSDRYANSLLPFVALAAFLTVPIVAAHGQSDDPDPARFEADIAAFEVLDAQESPRPGSVLFLGSSSIRMWPLDTCLPQVPTVNRGFGGSHYSDVLHFADRILAGQNPETIVLYAGDNDIESGKRPEQVADDCRRLIGRLREHAPTARILVIAIKPSPSRWERFPAMRQANALIRAHVDELENAEWINVVPHMLASNGIPRCCLFVEDGLHLNEQGYQIWTHLICRAMGRG